MFLIFIWFLFPLFDAISLLFLRRLLDTTFSRDCGFFYSPLCCLILLIPVFRSGVFQSVGFSFCSPSYLLLSFFCVYSTDASPELSLRFAWAESARRLRVGGWVKKLQALSNRPLPHEALGCLQSRVRVTVRGGSDRRGESGSKGIRAVAVALLPHRPDAH